MKLLKRSKPISIVLITALFLNVFAFVPNVSAATEQIAKKPTIAADIGELPNKLPKEKLELSNKRTKNSTRYLNPDGSFTEVIFSEPQFYQDTADKKWKPIERNPKANANKPDKLVNDKNEFKTSFANDASSPEILTVEKDGESVSMAPVKGKGSKPSVNGNKVVYKELFTNVDAHYYMFNNKVKEDLVLNQYNGQNTFTFELKLKGLKPAIEEGIITFIDNQGNKEWLLEKPFMTDAEEKYSDKVSYNLREEKGKTFIDVVADEAFLKDANTKYPVKIDPTIVKTDIQRDTYIASYYPDSSFYNDYYMYTGSDSYFGAQRSLVDFYLPSLPSGSKIESAAFSAFHVYDRATTYPVELYRVNSFWDGYVTWNTHPTIGSTPESVSSNTPTQGYWDWDISQLTKDWYNGTQKNYGLMLIQKNEMSTPYQAFSTASDVQNFPKITINYTVDPIGLENFWGLTQDGVNPANGNLVLQATDVSIPGRGVPVSLERTYNSRLASTPGIFGYGWTSNWESRIIHSGSGPIIFIDQDGTQHYFGELAAGKYVAPPGIYLDMVKNIDGTFILTQTDGTKINFDTSGKITSIVDSNGNTTGFTYDTNGKVSKITDASGRITTVNYGTHGFVSSVVDSANRTVSYVYDGNSNLTQFTDAEKHKITYAYDTAHKITGITDARTITTSYEYANDRVAKISCPLTLDGTLTTSTTSYVYDTTHLVTQVTDGEGKRIDYTVNANGNVVQITENPLDAANKAITTFAYDDYNNLTQIKDPNANATGSNSAYVYTYDERGNITQVTLPESQTSYNTYDGQNNLTQEKDFNGNTSNFGYDTGRNQTDATDPYLQTAASRYDAQGNLLHATIPLSAGDNLVPNSGFELDNDLNYWPDNWTTTIQPGRTATFNWSGTAKFGKKATSIANPTGWAIVSSSAVPYTSGQKFVASGYVKLDNTVGTAVVKVEFLNAYDAWLGEQKAYELKGTHDWTRIQTVIDSAPAGTAKVRITVGLNAGSGTAYFDGIQFEKGTTLSAYNLIDNAGFEMDFNGDRIPDNWTTSANWAYADGIDNTVKYAGNASLKLTGQKYVNKYINQHLNISGDTNTKYTLSGWSKQEGADVNGGYYSVQIALNYTDGTVDWTNASNFDLKATGWQHIAAEVNPKKAFSSVDVYYYYYNQLGTAWFDAIRLESGASHTFNTYDAQGNYVTSVKDPLGNLVSSTDDAAGNQTSVKDAKGKTTSFLYDALNRLTEVTDAKLGVTSYGYDAVGNRITVTDAKNNVTNYDYNEFNQVSAFTNALNQTVRFGYDKNGNTTKIIFPKGDAVSYSYNALNRLDGISYNGAKQWGIAYDANGNLTTVTDGAGNTTRSLTYDKNGRLTQQTEGAANKIQYGFDDNSNLTSVTATAGTTTVTTGYGYNPLNLMVALTRNGVKQADFVYDERSNLISTKYANGTYTAYEHDELSRLKSLINYNAAGAVSDSYAHSYDANGNITSIVTNAGTISYIYDELNQLTQETLADGTVMAYEYDAVGNRAKKTVTVGSTPTTTNYSYDIGNQLISVNGHAYAYDDNGNLTSNGAKTFTYDVENRLTAVKDAAGATIASFTYDHEGKRTSMTTATGTITFHYNGDKVVYETDANNNIVAEYTWNALGQPVNMTKNGVTYYYHHNGHGDVVKLTDASGNVVAEYSYDAWGNILSQSGAMASENPYRYAGYRYDEQTKLYYLMARYYDADDGRFLTRDTFHGFEDQPLTLNQYSYANGNPVFYFDSNGHIALPKKLTAAAINAGIALAVGGGVGLIQKFIINKGRDAAKRIFTKTVVSKLTALGAPKLAWMVAFAVEFALNFYDIGTAITNYIDSRDTYPNNGWLG